MEIPAKYTNSDGRVIPIPAELQDDYDVAVEICEPDNLLLTRVDKQKCLIESIASMQDWITEAMRILNAAYNRDAIHVHQDILQGPQYTLVPPKVCKVCVS
jgi:hypothetical protein